MNNKTMNFENTVEVERVGPPVSSPVPQAETPGWVELPSALQQYLREAAEVPLLTAQEEISLAHRIQQGDERAREHMIRANLRLVVKIARDYEGFGLPLLDMINEGNIGLMRAVEKFDPSKGCRFSTYAALWISQGVRRGLAYQAKTIRLPINQIDRLARLNRHSRAFQDSYGRVPTSEELSKLMGMSPDRIRRLQKAVVHTVSLEAPLGSSEDASAFGDLVEDPAAEQPGHALEQKTRFAMLLELVTKLSQRESNILRYRFGLDGGNERTLEEVGRHFGVTRERIRQLQNAALLKLRRMVEQREFVPG